MFFSRREGFTLIELMVVIALIGIVTTLSVAGYQRIQLRGQMLQAFEALRSRWGESFSSARSGPEYWHLFLKTGDSHFYHCRTDDGDSTSLRNNLASDCQNPRGLSHIVLPPSVEIQEIRSGDASGATLTGVVEFRFDPPYGDLLLHNDPTLPALFVKLHNPSPLSAEFLVWKTGLVESEMKSE